MTKSKATTRGLPETNRSLPFALLKAREKIMAPIREMLADSDITEQQWRVLRVLSEHGPQDITAIAERASIMLPSLSRIVQSMLEKGFVTRSANAQDRRKQTVAITPSGQKIIEQHLDEALSIAKRFEDVVGKKEFQHLLNTLAKFDEL